MAGHRIQWWLRRGKGVDPIGMVICDEPETSFCQNVETGECKAALWIHGIGAGRLWYGLDDTRAVDGPIDVWWEESDWVWCYSAEPEVKMIELPDIAEYEDEVVQDLSVVDERVGP